MQTLVNKIKQEDNVTRQSFIIKSFTDNYTELIANTHLVLNGREADYEYTLLLLFLSFA